MTDYNNEDTSFFDDLGFNCAEDAKKRIAAFYLAHNRLSIAPDTMLYIIDGLIFLENIAKTNKPNVDAAVEILCFIYQKKSLTFNDLELIAKSLKDIKGKNNLTPDTLNYLKSKTHHWNWVRTFVRSLEWFSVLTNPVTCKSITDGIVSKGKSTKKSSGGCEYLGFGYSENKGHKKYQSNALAWKPLSKKKLEEITDIEIGERLWSLYRDFDDQANSRFMIGSTAASTTVCTSNALITATLADTSSYVVVYKEDNEIEVHRLNQRTRLPTDNDETARITAANGAVLFGKVDGVSKNSRAIGDALHACVCADADIDIFKFDNINPKYKVQVITASSGLLNSDENLRTKSQSEAFLKKYLMSIQSEAQSSLQDLSECEISKRLIEKALKDGSKENISITVQTVREEGFSFTGIIGIYDGHDDRDVSQYVADNIGVEFEVMLNLEPNQYRTRKNSVMNNSDIFARDNPRLVNNKSVPQISPK